MSNGASQKSPYEQRITFHTLSAVTARIQEILQPSMGRVFWLKAEISSGRERGGSFYCDLVETDEKRDVVAQMRCTIWVKDLIEIKRKFSDCCMDLVLDNGTIVGLKCSLQFNPRYGLSLKAVDADPTFTLGHLELKKREILERLEKEGLLKKNKRLIVPLLPINIGLITSKSSAAVHDFINSLRRSGFGYRVYVADTIMQGDQTEKSVLTALNALERLKLDIVVLIRGGGSKLELFSLDNETIARRIANYKISVWTGIGHETDMSILDHVANKYFKTPTAVAEELVATFTEMKKNVGHAAHRLKTKWSYELQIQKKNLVNYRTGLFQGTRKMIASSNERFENKANLLSSKVAKRIYNEKLKLAGSKRTLTTAPLRTITGQAELQGRKAERCFSAYKSYINDIRRKMSNGETRFRSIWSYKSIQEVDYIYRAKIGIKQGTRKALDVQHATIKSMAALFASKAMDIITQNDARLIVAESSLKTGSLNEIRRLRRHAEVLADRLSNSANLQIKSKNKSLSRRRERFRFPRYQQYIDHERKVIVGAKVSMRGKCNGRLLVLQRGLSGVHARFNQERILKRISGEKKGLDSKLAAVRASDPVTTLRRGYSILYDDKNRIVKSVKAVSKGLSVSTILNDGTIASTVYDVEEKKYDRK